MKAQVAEVAGTTGTVRIVRQARKNSRVVPINPNTGQDTGDSFLVESNRLANVRPFDAAQAMAHSSHTVRLSGDTMSRIRKEAKPFETPDEVLRRLLGWA